MTTLLTFTAEPSCDFFFLQCFFLELVLASFFYLLISVYLSLIFPIFPSEWKTLLMRFSTCWPTSYVFQVPCFSWCHPFRGLPVLVGLGPLRSGAKRGLNMQVFFFFFKEIPVWEKMREPAVGRRAMRLRCNYTKWRRAEEKVGWKHSGLLCILRKFLKSFQGILKLKLTVTGTLGPLETTCLSIRVVLCPRVGAAHGRRGLSKTWRVGFKN